MCVCVWAVGVCLQSQQSLVTSRLILITAHIVGHLPYTYVPLYVYSTLVTYVCMSVSSCAANRGAANGTSTMRQSRMKDYW